MDWNEQAVKKAKSYLDYSSFSLQGLVEQLEYSGFTPSQAQYGATTAYGG
ncbi:Ltp family lipoprotein [Mycobacterium sp. DL592]|nr:Ltp family lipoprotein [Mycobacterium sp. DL592]